MQNKKVLIGVPSYSGQIPYQMVISLLKLHKTKQTAIQIIPRLRVDKARNHICLEAIKADVDYVLFLDDDNPIPPNTLTRFIQNDKDIIIPPILQRGGEHKICLFKSYIKKLKNGKEVTLYNNLKEFNPDENGLMEVDAGGMGATLVKIKVIKKLMDKYDGRPFEFGKIEVDGKTRLMSEDVEFCERAKKEGFKIFTDTLIRPIHLGDPQQFVYHEGINL